MTVVLNIRNEWKQEDGPNSIQWHTRVLILQPPWSTHLEKQKLQLLLLASLSKLIKGWEKQVGEVVTFVSLDGCRSGELKYKYTCVSVNWVRSILLFPFISYVQHNSHPYLPFLFRINFLGSLVVRILFTQDNLMFVNWNNLCIKCWKLANWHVRI